MRTKGGLLPVVPTKPNNTYWAVADVSVDYRIDYTSKPISLAVFNDRANRKERKLLAYENCTVTELRGFVKARHLKLPTNSRCTKEDYITTLQTADDEPDLSEFFDLAPPELREMVYKEYYADLPALPLNPHQPPLVLASSQLRAEALPLYYTECTFHLVIQTSFRQEHRHTVPVPQASFSNPKSELIPSGRVPTAELSRIRYINLLHSHTGRRDGQPTFRTRWNVDLRGEGGPAVGEWEDEAHWESDWYWAERRKRFGRSTKAVLRTVWARPGPGKLREEDATDLLEAAKMALA
jgi:hypothetical protein